MNVFFPSILLYTSFREDSRTSIHIRQIYMKGECRSSRKFHVILLRLSWPTSAPQLPVLYESNTCVQATTRLFVIEPILTGVDVFAANGTSAVMLHDDRANDPSFARAAVLNLSFSIISSIKYFYLGQCHKKRSLHGIFASEKNYCKFLQYSYK